MKIIRHIIGRHQLWKRMLLLIGGLFLLFVVLNILFPLKVDIEFAPLVEARDGTVVHAYLNSQDKWRMYLEVEEITPELKRAFLYKEDRYYNQHFGINPLALTRAIFNNVVKGKRTSGASTITMQVARLLEPKPRTYGNKMVEMFRALQLEWKFSKDEILQMYLNLVPYGGNIEGVKAASLLYFEKSPELLSLAELTSLAVIPNRPNSLTPGRHNHNIKAVRDQWLRRFQQAKIFPAADIKDALEEPLRAQRNAAPQFAPHFSYRVTRNNSRALVKTTLDWSLQQKVEALVKNYVGKIYHRNIKNAAVVVLDNRDNQVLAYVGSADFHNALDGGQVDGVRAIRSPGSTLKPLLYALAFDKGKVTPKTMIGDVPVYFSGYEPENYDERFHGNVSVEYALSNSLNIPAVKLLNEIGVSSLVTSLRNSGFQQISRDANKLGLSTILGGCGVRLEELAGLYSAFANGGTYRSHKFFPEHDMEDSLEIVTPGASYLLTEILTQVTRPDLPLQWHNAQNLPKVAWKTGTSYGRRDAWSVGYNQNFTVAVWVGNFSGEGVPNLTGADIAAPLFFQIFNAVDYQTPKDWYHLPESVGFRYVCSESGNKPNNFCDNQIMDYFLKNVSTVKKCQHLRPAWVDAQGSFSFCTSCLPEGGYKQEWYPNHSGPMLTYLQSHNIPYGEIPAHNPDCERVWVAGAPEITSPLHGTEYFVNESDSMQMLLSAHVQNDVKDIYWYIDNQFYKKAAYNEQVFFEPSQGKVKISCSDDKGRNTDIMVTVKKVGF